jgi:hypothetical protein
MTDLAQLEVYVRKLLTSINSLTTNPQDDGSILSPLGACPLSDSARESALATISKLQIILSRPTDFVRQMATQVFTDIYCPPLLRING